MRLKTFFQFDSDTDSAINRNNSDCFEMNFNQKLSPRLLFQYIHFLNIFVDVKLPLSVYSSIVLLVAADFRI